jgi:hypothetical protein
MTTRRLAAALCALALVVSACSRGSSPGSSAGPSAAGDTSALSVPQLPAAGGGSCTVAITGDVSKSWTASQTMGSLLVSYWLSPAEAAVLSLSADEAYFIMNCQGSDGSVSFTLTNNTTRAQFPEAPGTYVIPAAGGLLGLGGDPGQVGMLLSLHDSAIWNATEPGTFKITTFGGGKFAGTFQAKVGKLGDDLKTIAATATLSGSFDLSCTSQGCS